MNEDIKEMSELLNDACCLIKSAKDSCKLDEKIEQAVTLAYASKILNKLRDKLDLFEDKV